MVHALNEIQRVLKPGARLLDLRPLAGAWPIEVVSRREWLKVGNVQHEAEGLADDARADESLEGAQRSGVFIRERQDFFAFNYYWDSPAEMQEFIASDWSDFVTIPEAVWLAVRSAWAVADADARLRIPVRMQIARYRSA
jgi:hypothetical protein